MIQHLFCLLPLRHILSALNFITKKASFAVVVLKYCLFSFCVVCFFFFITHLLDLSLHLRSTAFTSPANIPKGLLISLRNML